MINLGRNLLFAKDRLHHALAQALMIDPYAKAVMRNSVEQMKILGDGRGYSACLPSLRWRVDDESGVP